MYVVLFDERRGWPDNGHSIYNRILGLFFANKSWAACAVKEQTSTYLHDQIMFFGSLFPECYNVGKVSGSVSE